MLQRILMGSLLLISLMSCQGAGGNLIESLQREQTLQDKINALQAPCFAFNNQNQLSEYQTMTVADLDCLITNYPQRKAELLKVKENPSCKYRKDHTLNACNVGSEYAVELGMICEASCFGGVGADWDQVLGYLKDASPSP